MSTVIVTGGCGYIGSHTIIELLQTTDFDVVSIDSCINSSEETLSNIETITGKRIANYKVDLCNFEDFKSVMTKIENPIGIIHFAALKSVPDSVSDPLFYYHNNFESLINVLKVCEEFNIQNHIFSSSCSVYGNVETLPVSETTTLMPTQSPYGHTKKVGEEIIEAFSLNSKVNTIALRYFNPVGAHPSGLNGESPINPPNNLVPVITRTASGIIPKMTVFGSDYETRDGTCVRDYVHVCDIASAHIKALNFLIEGKNGSNYEVINLGSGNGVTVLEAINAFKKVSGLDLNYELGPRRDGDVGAIYSDTTKSVELLGFEPVYSIDDMMDSAWKWQLKLNQTKDA